MFFRTCRALQVNNSRSRKVVSPVKKMMEGIARKSLRAAHNLNDDLSRADGALHRELTTGSSKKAALRSRIISLLDDTPPLTASSQRKELTESLTHLQNNIISRKRVKRRGAASTEHEEEVAPSAEGLLTRTGAASSGGNGSSRLISLGTHTQESAALTMSLFGDSSLLAATNTTNAGSRSVLANASQSQSSTEFLPPATGGPEIGKWNSWAETPEQRQLLQTAKRNFSYQVGLTTTFGVADLLSSSYSSDGSNGGGHGGNIGDQRIIRLKSERADVRSLLHYIQHGDGSGGGVVGGLEWKEGEEVVDDGINNNKRRRGGVCRLITCVDLLLACFNASESSRSSSSNSLSSSSAGKSSAGKASRLENDLILELALSEAVKFHGSKSALDLLEMTQRVVSVFLLQQLEQRDEKQKQISGSSSLEKKSSHFPTSPLSSRSLSLSSATAPASSSALSSIILAAKGGALLSRKESSKRKRKEEVLSGQCADLTNKLTSDLFFLPKSSSSVAESSSSSSGLLLDDSTESDLRGIATSLMRKFTAVSSLGFEEFVLSSGFPFALLYTTATTNHSGSSLSSTSNGSAAASKLCSQALARLLLGVVDLGLYHRGSGLDGFDERRREREVAAGSVGDGIPSNTTAVSQSHFSHWHRQRKWKQQALLNDSQRRRRGRGVGKEPLSPNSGSNSASWGGMLETLRRLKLEQEPWAVIALLKTLSSSIVEKEVLLKQHDQHHDSSPASSTQQQQRISSSLLPDILDQLVSAASKGGKDTLLASISNSLHPSSSVVASTNQSNNVRPLRQLQENPNQTAVARGSSGGVMVIQKLLIQSISRSLSSLYAELATAQGLLEMQQQRRPATVSPEGLLNATPPPASLVDSSSSSSDVVNSVIDRALDLEQEILLSCSSSSSSSTSQSMEGTTTTPAPLNTHPLPRMKTNPELWGAYIRQQPPAVGMRMLEENMPEYGVTPNEQIYAALAMSFLRKFDSKKGEGVRHSSSSSPTALLDEALSVLNAARSKELTGRPTVEASVLRLQCLARLLDAHAAALSGEGQRQQRSGGGDNGNASQAEETLQILIKKAEDELQYNLARELPPCFNLLQSFGSSGNSGGVSSHQTRRRGTWLPRSLWVSFSRLAESLERAEEALEQHHQLSPQTGNGGRDGGTSAAQDWEDALADPEPFGMAEVSPAAAVGSAVGKEQEDTHSTPEVAPEDIFF